MDDNTEIAEPNAELQIVGIFSDFSQVKIEVHGADVAEKILGDLPNQSVKDEYPTEYQECSDAGIDEQDIFDDPQHDSNNCSEVVLENHIETISICSSEPNVDDCQMLGDDPDQILEDCPEHILGGSPEQILGDCQEQLLEDCPEQHLQDCPEQNLEDSHEAISEDCPEQILGDCQSMQNEIESIQDDQMDTQEDFPEYMAQEIKEEIEQFEGTDFTDFYAEVPPPESYNNDLPPEDIYHYRSKIILGTKPCQNSPVSIEKIKTEIVDVSYEFQSNIEEDNLDAVVLLRDWGPDLEQSDSFCKKCGILFTTPNCLDSHNMTMHSFLVAVSKNVALKSTSKPAVTRKSTGELIIRNKFGNMARKSTGSTKVLTSYCNHCNLVFSDHTALITHLYELLPSKQFSCNVCEAVFNTQKDLIEHNTVHLKTEKTKIKKEKVDTKDTELKKKLVYKDDLKKKPVGPKADVDLIPLSVLFQCTKCNVHFLSALSAILHNLNCNSKSTSKKLANCTICKRKLRDMDISMHKKQHEVCTKFQVYKITKNLYERTLCKCPKCGVHFNDYTIKPHLKCCGKLPTACCQTCNILLPKSKIVVHLTRHWKEKLKAKDFIIVQYCIHNKGQKRKLEPSTGPAKKIKIELPMNKIKKEIVDKNTREPLQRLRQVPLRNPPVLVKQEKDVETRIKMADRLKFDKRPEKPHTRIFFCPHCKTCSVRFWRRTIHLNKGCLQGKAHGTSICPDCGLLFNKKTMFTHKRLHRMRKLTLPDMSFYHVSTLKRVVPTMPKYPQCDDCKITFFCENIKRNHICGEDYETCNVCSEKFHNSAYKAHIEFHKFIVSKQKKPKTEEKIMPELIKKYKSLNMMWNIIYLCKKCDIVTDLYDKAVEHSQLHLNHQSTLKNIKCYICNLKFDETCWSKHSDLHLRMNINSKDFKILVYDPKKLLDEDWFELFDSLPEDQIAQITCKSLYNYERGIKMNLVKDGRSEFTLNCCAVCKVCFHINEIDSHTKTTCRTTENICKICNVQFCDSHLLQSHEMLHSKGIAKEEFRVVSFAKKVIHKKVIHKKISSKKISAKFVIQKCRSCTSCMRYKHNIPRHKCLPKHRIAKCKKCNQYFNKSALKKHEDEHAVRPDFVLKNTRVEYFDPPCTRASDEDDDLEPLIKAHVSKKTSKPTKKTKHASKSHKPAKVPKREPVKLEPKTAKVFKCSCGLHFTSLKTIEKHSETCSNNINISKENCSKCGLLFPTDVLVSHLCKHHSNNTKIVIEPYTREEPETSFDSVESTSECQADTKRAGNLSDTTKLPTKNCTVKLYKCSECNIYYMNQNTCYRHVYKSHQLLDQRQFIECKLCGLQFTIKSLSIHIAKHHQTEFSLDAVLVEEYQPAIAKGPPKISIYIASEKVQSLLVTSSIEERVSSS